MEDRKSLETKVGLFTVFGLIVTAGLAIYFGRLTEPFQEKYTLMVHFPNAGGLLDGSRVMMAGAHIGQVADDPRIDLQHGGVTVPLRIYSEVTIPEGSSFRVRSSGLLGDAFVDVLPERGAEAGQAIEPGSRVEGDAGGDGIGELASSGKDLVQGLRETNAELQNLLKRLNRDVLNEEFVTDIHGTAANANEFTGELDEFADRLDEEVTTISTDLRETLGNLKKFSAQLEAIGSNAEATTENLRRGTEGLDAIVAKVDKTASGLNSMLGGAEGGEGLLPGLIQDRQLRDDAQATVRNLRDLSANLKRHGVLFYRDTAAETRPEAANGEEEMVEQSPRREAEETGLDRPSIRRRMPGRPGRR
jgi:phospholipid/cholesterol/gamma-HCH transport system substrate-binding protein